MVDSPGGTLLPANRRLQTMFFFPRQNPIVILALTTFALVAVAFDLDAFVQALAFGAVALAVAALIIGGLRS